MDEREEQATASTGDPVPMQTHTCTAVIEDLVAETPDSEWENVE
ncbi:MAG TPA: hypothetical protein VF902_06050 [Coriobacteriia bacterium]